jgi:hypothetical protein
MGGDTRGCNIVQDTPRFMSWRLRTVFKGRVHRASRIMISKTEGLSATLLYMPRLRSIPFFFSLEMGHLSPLWRLIRPSSTVTAPPSR